MDIEEQSGTEVLAWGSGEVDQFYIGEDQYDSRKPVPINYFLLNKIIIRDIDCGGQHTIYLSTMGKVYTQGGSDEGQLGRTEGPNNQPGLVDLQYLVDMISAGEAHSCAANSRNGILYSWGVFRNLGGNMSEVNRTPIRKGLSEFKGRTFNKLLSGNNHVMVLSDKKLFVWGDSETSVLGRMPLAKRKNQQSLMIGAIPIRGIIDTFTGGFHCFATAEKKHKDGTVDHVVYSWGKNNWGELGIGTEESTFHPTEIVELRNKRINNIVGGEDHTLFLTEEGEVFACGRNDDFQLGPINEDDIPMCKPNEDDQDRYDEHARRNAEEIKKAEAAGTPVPEKYVAPTEVKRTDTVISPVKVNLTEKVTQIMAAAHYNICCSETNQLYSWGLGFSYVLGNGKDEEVREPYSIKPEFFNNKTIGKLSLGSNHVVYAIGQQQFTSPDLGFTLDKITERLPRAKPKPRVTSIESSLERKLTEKMKKNKKKKSGSRAQSSKSRSISKQKSPSQSPIKQSPVKNSIIRAEPEISESVKVLVSEVVIEQSSKEVRVSESKTAVQPIKPEHPEQDVIQESIQQTGQESGHPVIVTKTIKQTRVDQTLILEQSAPAETQPQLPSE